MLESHPALRLKPWLYTYMLCDFGLVTSLSEPQFPICQIQVMNLHLMGKSVREPPLPDALGFPGTLLKCCMASPILLQSHMGPFHKVLKVSQSPGQAGCCVHASLTLHSVSAAPTQFVPLSVGVSKEF